MKHSILPSVLAFTALLAPARSASLYGVTADNMLVTFDTAAPSSFLSSVQITGLVGADGFTPNANGTILNLTARPTGAPGQYSLFGIDDSANFYQIASNGIAQLVATGFSPAGFSAGFAHDPFSDQFVYADDAAGSFSISTAGVVTTNPGLTYAGGGVPAVFGLGIDPFFGTVFVVDAATDTLYTSLDPLFPSASGELTEVGPLGIDVASFGGLVVDEDGNLFASLSTDGLTSGLFAIDPGTGSATALGGFGTGLSAIAVPEPSAALLGGIGLLALFRRRRA